ncbi:MBL fold metallo-hydrolase [Paenibacillus nasutitermitis]|uniref:Metallo-beta-lactamase domain-containing protein n=1 Tax=Paenibacillus nasutitermitis TaxID=1652958 RepID=A0A917DX63_9BACL|nr:MBL fold metallo-hydrolase [Paenibacillus nasutitermitis]GGD77269.1 hypothetical protein GCM10010911_39100 [Paenibacillus nasutitermitis]
MKLIVLGKYGTFPAAGGACSGYLIENNGRYLLIDCGNGVLSRLQHICRIEDLEAIVLSHLHDDHAGDLRILKYAVETKLAFGTMRHRVKVYMPSSPERAARDLDYPQAFDISYVNEKTELELAGLHLRFCPMRHSIETYAISLEAGAKKLVYSADTTFHEGLIRFAAGADVLLCEATLAEAGDVPIPHMTALEAGETARLAGVERLLLTHLWCDEDAERCLLTARTVFEQSEEVMELQEYVI